MGSSQSAPDLKGSYLTVWVFLYLRCILTSYVSRRCSFYGCLRHSPKSYMSFLSLP